MTYETLVKLREQCKELEEYAELMNDELGELCTILSRLSSYSDYYSDEFGDALVKEIKDQLQNIVENARVVEEEETITRTVRSLEWD